VSNRLMFSAYSTIWRNTFFYFFLMSRFSLRVLGQYQARTRHGPLWLLLPVQPQGNLRFHKEVWNKVL